MKTQDFTDVYWGLIHDSRWPHMEGVPSSGHQIMGSSPGKLFYFIYVIFYAPQLVCTCTVI